MGLSIQPLIEIEIGNEVKMTALLNRWCLFANREYNIINKPDADSPASMPSENMHMRSMKINKSVAMK